MTFTRALIACMLPRTVLRGAMETRQRNVDHLNVNVFRKALRMNTTEALAHFDSLQPVAIEFMIGQWHGASFATGHPWDGLLEKYHWYGKRFIDADNVHPLVYHSVFGRLVPVNPLFMPMSLLRLRMFHSAIFGKMFQLTLFLFRAWSSGARLRMMECRGKTSAAMVYDRQPIIDAFRKIDGNKVLGMMDFKGMERPYFFTLERD